MYEKKSDKEIISLIENARTYVGVKLYYDVIVTLIKALNINPVQFSIFTTEFNALSENYSEKDFKKLIEICSENLEDNVDNNWLAVKGIFHLYLYEYELAENCFNILLKNPSLKEFALVSKASVIGRSSDYDGFKEFTYELEDHISDNVVFNIFKAKCFNSCVRYDEAIAALDDVLKKDPNNPDALISKAYALHEKGNHKQAMEVLDDAEKIIPDVVHVWSLKAKCEWALDDKSEKVLEYFDKAIECDPNYDDVWFEKGMYFFFKDISKARECFIKAFELNPQSHGIVDKKRFFDMLNILEKSGL